MSDIDESTASSGAEGQDSGPVLQGFQLLSTSAAGPERDEEKDSAVVVALDARAERFRQAVDASIVLDNDGVIRWLGEPIARLLKGLDLFAPVAILLADIRLSESARQAVERRIELWLSAQLNKLLGPLMALRTLSEGPQPAIEIGRRISEALGVLERKHVRAEIKALDQDARVGLRKLGVRFGAHFIFVPVTLKPASRALALHLWIAHAQLDGNGAPALALLTNSGRTSSVLDPSISAEAYRVAGFCRCGQRVVRVDIVERLTDLIRSAISQKIHDPDGAGFEVTPQMTSLTGCSGESFESILGALGFERYEAARSVDPPAAPLDPEGAAAPDEEAARAKLAGGGSPEPAEAEKPIGPDERAIGDMCPDDYPRADGYCEAIRAPTVGTQDLLLAEATEGASGGDGGEWIGANSAEDPTPSPEPVATKRIVVLWRPARRPRAEPRPEKRPRTPAGEASRKQAGRSRKGSADKGFRRSPESGGELRAQGGAERGKDMRRAPPDQPPKTDPDSPFAKLANLRALLLENEKGRR